MSLKIKPPNFDDLLDQLTYIALYLFFFLVKDLYYSLGVNKLYSLFRLYNLTYLVVQWNCFFFFF